MPLFSLVILRDLFPIHWTLIYIYAPQLNSARLSRLGPCDSCSVAESKYRCPRCEVTSCSLECVQSHKSRTKCSGTRDKTKYIATNKFTDLDLLSDYRLLEEIGRVVDICERDKSNGKTSHPHHRQDREPLSENFKKLRNACKWRKGPRLLFQPSHFERHKTNTSIYDWESRQIEWKLELVFPHCQKNIVIPRVHEKTKLYELLLPYIEADDHFPDLEEDPFACYRALGFNGVQVLLKNENIHAEPGTLNRFVELNLKQSLQSNLREKWVVEHPIVFVILKHHRDFFLEDTNTESQKASQDLDWSHFQKTTIKSNMAAASDEGKPDLKRKLDEDPQESEPTEVPSMAPKTFGLFAGDSEPDSDEETEKPKPEVSCVTQVDQNEQISKMLNENAVKWKKPRQEFDDNAFVRSFVNQQESEREGAPETSEKGAEKETPMDEEKDAKAYEQYYDYYLNYYQKKYNLLDQSPTVPEGEVDSKDSEPGTKALGPLVDYGSDSE